jgi:hypothetical protein
MKSCVESLGRGGHSLYSQVRVYVAYAAKLFVFIKDVLRIAGLVGWADKLDRVSILVTNST